MHACPFLVAADRRREEQQELLERQRQQEAANKEKTITLLRQVFGDWEGDILVVGEDWAGEGVIQDRSERGSGRMPLPLELQTAQSKQAGFSIVASFWVDTKIH